MELASHTIPDNMIGRRSEPMVIDILTFELYYVDIHMEEVLYADIDQSCIAEEWINYFSFPSDRPIKRYLFVASECSRCCCLVRW